MVVGSGVSLTATHGAPVASWTGLIADGIQTAEAQRPDLPAGWASRAREELEGGSLDELLIVAEKVARALGPPTGGTWRHWLRRTVGGLRAIDPRVPLALGNLGVPLATTNYDDILSETTGAAAGHVAAAPQGSGGVAA